MRVPGASQLGVATPPSVAEQFASSPLPGHRILTTPACPPWCRIPLDNRACGAACSVRALRGPPENRTRSGARGGPEKATSYHRRMSDGDY